MTLFSSKYFLKIATKPRHLFLMIVIIPYLLATIYFLFFAVDRYVSNAQVVVKQADSKVSPASAGLAILTGGVDPSSQEYTLYLQEYINSYDMLNYLDKSIGWTSHYSNIYRDPLYYLAEETSLEDKLEFYNKMVTTFYDPTTGLLSVDAQALTGEYAEKTVQTILERAKYFINEVSREMTIEQVAFANTELKLSIERYQDSKNAMEAFQNEYGLLDLEATAQSMLEIVSSLESEIAKENVRLKSLESTLSAGAPQIKSLKNKIESLKQQLEIEKSKLTATTNITDSFNALASEYRQLQVNLLVSEEFYKASLALVESAKLDAIKNVRSLVTIVKPIQPEEAIYPKKVYNLITIFIILCLLYGVLRFVIASIRDHYE